MVQGIIELLNEGAEANYSDAFRKGNIIQLPARGSLVVSGDIHGHRRNFERIVKLADLGGNPDRHVVLQEIIHGGPVDEHGDCLSYHLLFDVARYKLDFPDRVHIIMGNHDVSFIQNVEIMKNGKEMNRSIRRALAAEYGPESKQIEGAMSGFLFSQPLAVRCENRIWISHSLPSDLYIDKFDAEVFNRPLKESDIVKPGSAYLLIWGRNYSPELVNDMARLFDVDVFVVGHQPQQQGWSRFGDNLIIIASDHNHGCVLKLDLAKSYTIEQLEEAVVPLSSIG